MFITNKKKYPMIAVDTIKHLRAKYNKGDADHSITELVGSPLHKILEERHHDELEVDIDTLFFMFGGDMAHYVVENAVLDYIMYKEHRMFVKINGVTVSGKLDIVYRESENINLDDIKWTGKSVADKPLRKSWGRQANAYRYMLSETEGVTADSLGILAFYRNATMFDRKFDRLPVKMFTMDKVREFLEKQIAFHKLCRSDMVAQIPECTPDDRWIVPEHWKVKKNKAAKRSLRNHATLAGATEHLDNATSDKYPDAVMEHHVAYNRKCEEVCSVSKFCWWFQDLKKGYITDSYNCVGEEVPERKKIGG